MFLTAGILVSIDAVVGFIASLVLGVPILKIFIRQGFTSGLAFLGAGFIISASSGTVFDISHQFGDKLAGQGLQFRHARGVYLGTARMLVLLACL